MRVHCRQKSVITGILDFVYLAETWFSDGIHNSELCSPFYSVIRRDRNFNTVNSKRGGGVLAYRVGFPFTNSSLYIPPDVIATDFEMFFRLLMSMFAIVVMMYFNIDIELNRNRGSEIKSTSGNLTKLFT